MHAPIPDRRAATAPACGRRRRSGPRSPPSANSFDFTEIDRLFPHPAYGANGWASATNPGERTHRTLQEFLGFALQRA
ncbi:DUF6194 family protein [Lysobacter firmicutimachus]|uniref:DUF6194 family protein n=1 Tax=Lysobacter firmicutimachus TaxID=1792846 RepID=A0AAU8MYZ6_9GAMM